MNFHGHKVNRELPEEVVEHILSFIPIEQVLQSSIFSKRWKRVWTRFPIWGFDEMYIKLKIWNLKRKRDGLYSFVDENL